MLHIFIILSSMLSSCTKQIHYYKSKDNVFIMNRDDLTESLKIAVYKNDTTTALRLIDTGANPNAILEAPLSISVLSQAALLGNLEIVTALLDKGADVNMKDIFGNASLKYAVQSNNLEIVTALLDKKAYVDIKDISGNTPLIISIQMGLTDILNALLRYNADPNIKNDTNKTALVYAIIAQNLNYVEALLDYSADPSMKLNDEGATAIAIAKYFRDRSLINKVCKDNSIFNKIINKTTLGISLIISGIVLQFMTN